jgi:hypothetical protein
MITDITPEGYSKLMEFLTLGEGIGRNKVREFLASKKSNSTLRYLGQTPQTAPTTEPKMEEPPTEPNMEFLETLKKSVEEEEFWEISLSDRHRRKCAQVTVHTSSSWVCHWCLSTTCMTKQTAYLQTTQGKLSSKPITTYVGNPQWMTVRERVTGHLCEVWTKKWRSWVKNLNTIEPGTN